MPSPDAAQSASMPSPDAAQSASMPTHDLQAASGHGRMVGAPPFPGPVGEVAARD
jgi:hypothetical protein